MDFAGTALRETTGTLQGVATSAITVDKKINVMINGTQIGCRAARDLTAAIGDIILLQRHNQQLIAIARLFAAAPAADDDENIDPPPPPQSETTSGTLVVAPVETRSYRNTVFTGWRKDNDRVYQGQYGGNGRHIGCVFYGTKPRSLKGATVTSASIRAKRLQGGDFAARQTTLRMITNKTKPSGAPDFYTSTDANGPNLAVGKSDTTISIPDAFAQALVDGNAGGFAIYESDGSPYVVLAGRSDWSQSFTLTIKWKRTA